MIGRLLGFRINATALLVVLLLSTFFITLVTYRSLPPDPLEGEPQPSVSRKRDKGLEYTAHLPPTLSIRPFSYNVTKVPASFWMVKPPDDYRQMTCSQLYNRHVFEYDEVNSQSPHHFFHTQITYHEMFRDPHPACGRYMLSHWFNEEHKYLFVLRASLPSASDILEVTAGGWSQSVEVEQCGTCLESKENKACIDDVEFIARLFNENRVLAAQVIRPTPQLDASKAGSFVSRIVRFRVPDPGNYTLEVKMVHLNSNTGVPWGSRTLGVVSGWGNDTTRSVFTYNSICDVQRHVYGSPLRIRVVPAPRPATAALPPLCNASTNYNTSEGGQWVRFLDGADSSTPLGSPHPLAAQCTKGDRYCYGDPSMLTDPRGLNSHLVWVPTTCRLRIVSGEGRDPFPMICRRMSIFSGKPTVVLFAGGAIVNEYYKNCQSLEKKVGNSVIHCLYRKINYNLTERRASSPRKALVELLDNIQEPVNVFVTNLGMEDLLEAWETKDWVEVMRAFAEEWRQQKVTLLRGPYTRWPPFGAEPTVAAPGETDWQQYMWDQKYRSKAMEDSRSTKCAFPCVEWAIWLSPPTVHYTVTGATQNRSMDWDRMAYKVLKKIGFTRLDSMTPTHSRQEGSWDGLRYMALSAYEPLSSPEPRRQVEEDSGGVSYMLFVILLNVVCFS